MIIEILQKQTPKIVCFQILYFITIMLQINQTKYHLINKFK